ncbi:hypothetical protein AB0L83_22115 [Streptomyces sp. NPDC052071]|uniref:hypothetical protein n=1 Tax=Streptomyces sp. NPDC052071 TaxID=3156666 RepID=UPI0034135E3A
MRIFGREPALILNTLAGVLGLLVTFQIGGLSSEQAGWIVAGTSAIFGAVAAAMTRPIAVQAFTAAVATIASAVAAFGYEAAPTHVAAINGFILAVLMFVTRGQVTPLVPTAPAKTPAG